MEEFRALILMESQAEPGAPEGEPGEKPQANPWGIWPMFLIMFIIIYFMMIRPGQRDRKKREGMLSAIKKNDKVLTSGGIYGIIHKIRDNEVELKIDERKDVRIRVARSAIVGVEKTSGAGDSEKKEPESEQAER